MNIKFADIHAHLQFPQFDADREEVIGEMKEKGIGAIIVGTDLKMSRAALALAKKYDHLWASVGLHPNDIFHEAFDVKIYRELIAHQKVVAVGECGLDYYRSPRMHADGETRIGADKETLMRADKNTIHPHLSVSGPRLSAAAIAAYQKEILRAHINLAAENDKPLMIHCRPSSGTIDAYEDVLEEITRGQDMHGARVRGNIHFFAGSPDIAGRFIEKNFTISFTGVVTFARDYDEALRSSPREMFMAETDAPFVAPAPFRGKCNSPLYMPEIVKKMAEVRGENFEEVKILILANANRVFGLKISIQQDKQ